MAGIDWSHVERMLLAEHWRRLGEKLRKRSPRQFGKMIEMLAASALDDEDDTSHEIDSVYQIH